VPAAYRHALVLCRDDQHVAWRGDRVPSDPASLIALLRGSRRLAVSPQANPSTATQHKEPA
jgi:hypothetical protein